MASGADWENVGLDPDSFGNGSDLHMKVRAGSSGLPTEQCRGQLCQSAGDEVALVAAGKRHGEPLRGGDVGSSIVASAPVRSSAAAARWLASSVSSAASSTLASRKIKSVARP